MKTLVLARKTKVLRSYNVPIRERVYGDIGEASMCWENPGGCGVFDASLELCQFVLKEAAKPR